MNDHQDIVEVRRDLIWQAEYAAGLETLRMFESDQGITIDSTVLGCADEKTFRIQYQIYLNSDWSMNYFRVENLDFDHRVTVHPHRNAWIASGFEYELGEFTNCPDIDISITPFTNTLAIKRLKLEVGQSADIQALFVDCPKIEFRISKQRYERLAEFEYRYTSLESGFTAEITVDADDLVVDYPGLFTRRFL